MDLTQTYVFFSLLSGLMQMVATVLVLICIINFFSLRSEGALKIVVFGIFYFFSSAFLLLIGVIWLGDLSVPFSTFMGVYALAEALLVHLGCTVLIVLLYRNSIRDKAH